MFYEIATNIIFLVIFSAVILAVYYLIKKEARPAFLLLVSFLFHFLCSWKMALVLSCCVVWTWFCALQIEQKRTHQKRWLLAGCTSLIVLLAFFKYNHFFVVQANRVLAVFGLNSTLTGFLMPLGISYYVFKALSFMIDVYRGMRSDKDFLTYGLYLSYFAESISGPISRYVPFHTSVHSGMAYSSKNMELGFSLILKGLFMKCVIANRLSGYVGSIFGSPEKYPAIALWIAAVFYAVQLYCDFGGYSFIATGITQMFGLHCTENFKRPYFSASIPEFWNRWHISLSSWLRDYVYIPLGGSRCSTLRTGLHKIVVFLISGLWHGAGLNFIVWGLYHGVLNAMTPKKLRSLTGIKRTSLIFPNFCLVTLGWIFFGTDSLHGAATYLKCMISNFSLSMSAVQQAILPFTNDNTCIAFFLTAVFFVFVFVIRELYEEKKQINDPQTPSFLWQVFLLTSILLFGNFATSGLIYANF